MKRLTESHLLSECSSHIANTFGTSSRQPVVWRSLSLGAGMARQQRLRYILVIGRA